MESEARSKQNTPYNQTMTTSSTPSATSLHSSQDMNEFAQTPSPVETMSESTLNPNCEKRRGRSARSSSSTSVTAAARVLSLSAGLLLCLQQLQFAHAWGSSSSNSGETVYSLYGNGFTRDWLYDSSSIAFKVEGCAWGLVEDSEEVGCLQDESEDGTTNWYMMANCRRPQVIYSVYASSSGSASCNDNNFVGSVRMHRVHYRPSSLFFFPGGYQEASLIIMDLTLNFRILLTFFFYFFPFITVRYNDWSVRIPWISCPIRRKLCQQRER